MDTEKLLNISPHQFAMDIARDLRDEGVSAPLTFTVYADLLRAEVPQIKTRQTKIRTPRVIYKLLHRIPGNR